jgi:hypothetical protein
MIYEGSSEQRIAYIAALRDLADWLEVTPDVPVPSFGHDLQLSLCGTEEQRRQDMRDAAAMFGSEPVDPYGDGTHLEVAKTFGPIKYFVHFASEAYTREYHEKERLGAEALAAKKAAVPPHVTGEGAALLIGGDEEADDDVPTVVPGYSTYSDPAVRAAIRDSLAGGSR